jgi:heme b synthase
MAEGRLMHGMMTGDSSLRLVFWELTARCNLKCQHCRAEAQDDFAAGELSTDEILQVARDIREEGDPIIVLTGGEPLVRKDIFHIASECSKIFSNVALATNGTNIDEETAAKVIESGIRRVSISLDGSNAATHDAFRGQPGSFENALAGFDALKAAGASMQINATVTKHNEDEVSDLLDFVLERGADAFHVFMLVPVGCGVEIADDQRLSPERFEEVLRWLFDKSIELADRLHIKATCAPQYYRIMRQVSKERGIPLAGGGHGMHAVTRGCLAGTGVCFISRTGDVQPCGYLPVQVGNVCKQKFGEIWRDSDVFASLRDTEQLTGKCGACGYRKVCEGCRARAYAETGDYLAEEPDCPYIPGADSTT